MHRAVLANVHMRRAWARRARSHMLPRLPGESRARHTDICYGINRLRSRKYHVMNGARRARLNTKCYGPGVCILIGKGAITRALDHVGRMCAHMSAHVFTCKRNGGRHRLSQNLPPKAPQNLHPKLGRWFGGFEFAGCAEHEATQRSFTQHSTPQHSTTQRGTTYHKPP